PCGFQAEDRIRGRSVTGVQTCALPSSPWAGLVAPTEWAARRAPRRDPAPTPERPGRGRGPVAPDAGHPAPLVETDAVRSTAPGVGVRHERARAAYPHVGAPAATARHGRTGHQISKARHIG